MNWSSIIRQLSQGNNEVLGEFYKSHAEYCIKKLTNENQCSRDDASDIFIEAIMSLRAKLLDGKIDSILNTRGYLYKTCHYMLLNRLEQNSRRKKKASDVERFYYTSVYHEEGNKTEFEPELMQVTMTAWNYLSERCKDILNFFYIEKLDMQEIAKLMSLSNANVAKTTKSRCYKTFLNKGQELKMKLDAKVES